MALRIGVNVLKEGERRWAKKLKSTQFSSSHFQLEIPIPVGVFYINKCGTQSDVIVRLDRIYQFFQCNKQLKMALIQLVRSGIKILKEFVKITMIFSCTDWTPDNWACLECALIQITGDTLNCYRLRVLTGHSDMEPGYHKAAKIFALLSTMAKQSLDIIKCLFFLWLTMPRTLQKCYQLSEEFWAFWCFKRWSIFSEWH